MRITSGKISHKKREQSKADVGIGPTSIIFHFAGHPDMNRNRMLTEGHCFQLHNVTAESFHKKTPGS